LTEAQTIDTGRKMSTTPSQDHFRAGQEGFRQAMTKGETPPRVPVYAQHHEFTVKRFGLSPRDFYRDPQLMVETQLATTAEFGFDLPSVDWDYYNLEAEAIGQEIAFPDNGTPDIDRTRPLIASEADLDRIATPDFEAAGRFRSIVHLIELVAEKTGLPPSLMVTAPFSLAANIRGIEALLLDMHWSPGFAHQIFRRLIDEVVGPWIEHVRNRFPDITSVSAADATASIPIVSPVVARDWVIPYVDRLSRLTGSRVGIANWVGEAQLEDPTEFMDLKLDVADRYIEGQDPDIEKLGPEWYVTYADHHDIPLVLGVGSAFMAMAEPAQVHDRVAHYVRAGMEHHSFALYLSNLGALTPEANVRAAVDAVHRVGRY
jgi:uroporphyrinogen-III decarboxylase